jgi:hypothetical protein
MQLHFRIKLGLDYQAIYKIQLIFQHQYGCEHLKRKLIQDFKEQLYRFDKVDLEGMIFIFGIVLSYKC